MGRDSCPRPLHLPSVAQTRVSTLHAERLKHSDVVPRRLFAGKLVDDVLPPIGSHFSPVLGVLRQVENRSYKLFAVLGFHKNAGAGLFDNLARLPVDSDDDRPFARHVFEKLGGNHRLEQLGFFQHN